METIKNYILNNPSIISSIVTAIISGFIAFLIAKYTYNKSRPLDKLEFAYNEVYYPIYKFIKDENNYNNVYLTKNSLKIYFDTYEKYLDFSTIKIYKELCNCDSKSKAKAIYRRFYNNIYDMNTYLRKRLGYLEPSAFQLFRYLTIQKQLDVGIIFSVAGACICLNLCLILNSLIENLLAIFITFCFFIVVLLFTKVIMFFMDKIF